MRPTQTEERWKLEGLDDTGAVVVATSATEDLAEADTSRQDDVGSHDFSGVTQVRGYHALGDQGVLSSITADYAEFWSANCGNEPVEEGTIAGTVVDATTAAPIEGATVELAGIGTAATAADGTYTFAGVPATDQALEAMATGYVPSSTTTTVGAGETVTVNFQLSPIGEPRAVLSWNDLDSDIDLHVSGPDGASGRFHAYFADPNPVPHVSLDVDDVDFEGPETVTVSITPAVPGDYHVWLHDYPGFADDPTIAGAESILRLFSATAQVGEWAAATDATTGDPNEKLLHVANFTIDASGAMTTVTPIMTYMAGDASTEL